MSTAVRRGTLEIGLFIDNLRLPLRDGLRKAAALGVESFQYFTTKDDTRPEAMTADARAEFRRFFEGLGLRLSATCADAGPCFINREKAEEIMPHLFAQVDLAVDLGTSVITTHIGVVPEERDEIWETMRLGLNEIGAYAEQRGVVLATETGPESGPVLRDLLLTLDTPAVRVNFDPANLVMNGYDLDEAIDALLPFIAHTHAKDGFRDPGHWREAPLGCGDVPWPRYVARMQTAGYHGPYTIEREQAEDPIADVTAAIEFLRQF